MKLADIDLCCCFSEISDSEITNASGSTGASEEPMPTILLKKKNFSGKYAIAAAEFNNDFVCSLFRLKMKKIVSRKPHL